MDKLKEAFIKELRSRPLSKKLIQHLNSVFDERERLLVKAIYKAETTVRPYLFRRFEFIYAYIKIILYLIRLSKSYNTTVGPFQIGIQTSFNWISKNPSILEIFKEPIHLMTLSGSCNRLRAGIDKYYEISGDQELKDVTGIAEFYNGLQVKVDNKLPYHQVLHYSGFISSILLDNNHKSADLKHLEKNLTSAIGHRFEKLKNLVMIPEKLGCAALIVDSETREIFFEHYIGMEIQNKPVIDQPRLIASLAKIPLFMLSYEILNYSNNEVFIDMPVEIKSLRNKFTVRNADRKYRGSVSLEYSFANSINTVAIQVIQKLGRSNLIKYFRTVKIFKPLPNSDLLALGAFRLTGRELLTLFSPIFHGGHLINFQEDNQKFQSGRRIIRNTSVQRIRKAMGASVVNGTCKYLSKHQIQGLLGKTGTSEKNRDFWFFGSANDRYYGLVWIGNYDNTEVVGKAQYVPSATRFAVPMWSEITYCLNQRIK